jgi:hypothetical protein
MIQTLMPFRTLIRNASWFEPGIFETALGMNQRAGGRAFIGKKHGQKSRDTVLLK